tara:strand:+ start:13457 stop:14338 length:882 start_codon:yes stop_codon:yes gene_type:complete
MDGTIKHALVIGAGTMGKGIAQWLAQSGVRATLCDLRGEVATSAHKDIELSWQKLVQKGKFTAEQVDAMGENLNAIALSDIDAENDAPDLIIEAIVESLEAKNKLFSELDQSMPEKTIFASNTSSIPIARLALAVSHKRRERFLGLHFFNPAPIMKLVEIIKGPGTKSELISHLYLWFQGKGKKPAICADSPGFIVNRVARNFYGEAFRVIKHEHPGKVKAVDEIMRSCGGFRMGPFELMDLIGIDINYDVTQSVWRDFFLDPRFAPHPLQRKMVESGRLGKKTKQGFYHHDD